MHRNSNLQILPTDLMFDLGASRQVKDDLEFVPVRQTYYAQLRQAGQR